MVVCTKRNAAKYTRIGEPIDINIPSGETLSLTLKPDRSLKGTVREEGFRVNREEYA